jgi:hypothetical protein
MRGPDARLVGHQRGHRQHDQLCGGERADEAARQPVGFAVDDGKDGAR